MKIGCLFSMQAMSHACMHIPGTCILRQYCTAMQEILPIFSAIAIKNIFVDYFKQTWLVMTDFNLDCLQ